jgi:hypothetical protein
MSAGNGGKRKSKNNSRGERELETLFISFYLGKVNHLFPFPAFPARRHLSADRHQQTRGTKHKEVRNTDKK